MIKKLLLGIAPWPAIAGLALLGVASPVTSAPGERLQPDNMTQPPSAAAPGIRMHPDVAPPSAAAPRIRMHPDVAPPSAAAPRIRMHPDMGQPVFQTTPNTPGTLMPRPAVIPRTSVSRPPQ